MSRLSDTLMGFILALSEITWRNWSKVKVTVTYEIQCLWHLIIQIQNVLSCSSLIHAVRPLSVSCLCTILSPDKEWVNLFAFCCLQEEILSLRCTLRCLYPRWAPCHETEGEVWAEETFGAVVTHTCCIQVRKVIASTSKLSLINQSIK